MGYHSINESITGLQLVKDIQLLVSVSIYTCQFYIEFNPHQLQVQFTASLVPSWQSSLFQNNILSAPQDSESVRPKKISQHHPKRKQTNQSNVRYQFLTHKQYGGFHPVMTGYPQSSSIYRDGIFPWNNHPANLGVPPWGAGNPQKNVASEHGIQQRCPDRVWEKNRHRCYRGLNHRQTSSFSRGST